MKRFLLIAMLFLVGMRVMAQGEDVLDFEGKIPILGKIINTDSLSPVRNTHVISKMLHCGTISNRDGIFFIPAKTTDTLWVSCIGYGRRLIPINPSMAEVDTLVIALQRDTITLKEVTVLPFYDYKTFKQMIIEMPSKPIPRELQRLNDELAGMKSDRKHNKYFDASGNGIVMSPIQYLYDKYNFSTRRQAKLLRNRRMFNEILKEQGRTDELLPDSMDYSVEYRVYEYDDIK